MSVDHKYDLLIVSDLHLSEGRSFDTKKISLNEDFFFDEEFARFLQFHARATAAGLSRKWHLIINGDFLDFLQVISRISEDSDRDFLDYLQVTPRNKLTRYCTSTVSTLSTAWVPGQERRSTSSGRSCRGTGYFSRPSPNLS